MAVAGIMVLIATCAAAELWAGLHSRRRDATVLSAASDRS